MKRSSCLISVFSIWIGLTVCGCEKSWWEESDKKYTFDLSGHRILVVLGDDFDFHEFAVVKKHLEKWGAEVKTVGLDQKLNGHVLKPTAVGWINSEYREIVIDLSISQVDLSKVDALFFPGGNSPEYLLREDSLAIVSLIRKANERGVTLAAICHGTRLFASADIINGRRVTGHPDVHANLISAGGVLICADAVSDGNLITTNWPKFETTAVKIAQQILENDSINQADRSATGARPNRVSLNAVQ